jgi:hypothetical protein
MEARTESPHSYGVPRVGPRASRAMAGAPQRRGGLDKTMERVEFESMNLSRIHSE